MCLKLCIQIGKLSRKTLVLSVLFNLFLFIARIYIYFFCIIFSIDDLDCFHLLLIMDQATMNFGVQISI